VNSEFIQLAESIKANLESRFSHDMLSKMYVYESLLGIIAEFHNGNFSSNRSDIGVAAAKSFDSNSREDNELLNDIGRLARMYKKGR
jgi:hypothetical protein